MADLGQAYNASEDVRPALRVGALAGLRVGSLIAGFIAGAVFWHFVGFWDFVSKVVLADPAEPAMEQKAEAAAAAVPHANCIALSIDRMHGDTLSSACLGGDSHLHDLVHGRADLLPIARSRSGFQPASRARRSAAAEPLQK